MFGKDCGRAESGDNVGRTGNKTSNKNTKTYDGDESIVSYDDRIKVYVQVQYIYGNIEKSFA